MNESLRYLLEEQGLGLADIARAILYPEAALRRFRDGRLADENSVATRDIEDSLADLAALCRQLAAAGAEDPAMLLTCPIVTGYTVTGITLLRDTHRLPLFELAAGGDPEQVLDRHVLNWRQHYWTDYEVFRAEDGCLSIRLKPGLP